MINANLSMNLSAPWNGEDFILESFGPVNFLVGPNGSGKSQFAYNLHNALLNQRGSTRLLATDRLRGMEQRGMGYFGNNFRGGIARNQFGNLKEASSDEGMGMDAIVLLEERMDLRIQIEATISHLFGRDISLQWDSGNLIPMAVRREGGASYRLDRQECHGIKELFVLLTHLYDTTHDYLIIDEPELNLHPQYQAFFMQEVRKVAGDPKVLPDKKVIFLITHSPFILDLRSEDDLKSIISFDLEYSEPKHFARVETNVISSIFTAGKLNAHHKQLFFSDNPVFVEGPFDARIVEALMEARGVSITGAGSCIIDSGGVEDVNHYYKLCQGVGKDAHFVYDLDSLFIGNLRKCIGGDDSIRSFLASAGLGSDFGKYVGELDRRLTDVIDKLLISSLSDDLKALREFLGSFGSNRKHWSKDQLAKARVAVMTAISLHRDDIKAAVSEAIVEEIIGRWNKILTTLKEKNIQILPGGTLERYLPSFKGNIYDPSPEAKRQAVEAELKQLRDIQEYSDVRREDCLINRYEDLYSLVKELPSKAEVDFDTTLRRHISDYNHELQKVVNDNPAWCIDQIQTHMNQHPLQSCGVVSLSDFDRAGNNRFSATIYIRSILGKGSRVLKVDENTTIGNMKDFQKS